MEWLICPFRALGYGASSLTRGACRRAEMSCPSGALPVCLFLIPYFLPVRSGGLIRYFRLKIGNR